MEGFEFKLIDANDLAEVTDDVLTLSNSFSCVLNLQILYNDKITNSFETMYDSDNSWLSIRKNFVIAEQDEIKSNFTIYVNDNYTKYERYYYLSVRSNFNGSIATLIIKQPQCNFNIEAERTDIKNGDNSITILKPNNTIKYKIVVKGASQIPIISDNYIEIFSNKIMFKDTEYSVINDKVSIPVIYNVFTKDRKDYIRYNGGDYEVTNNVVSIERKEYVVEEGTITIDEVYSIKNDSVTIYDKATIAGGKVVINGIAYSAEVVDDKVKINGIEYPVKDEAVILKTYVCDVIEMSYDYDNSLSYSLTKKDKNEVSTEYELTVTLVGQFTGNDNSYYYHFPIVHKDDRQTKKILIFNIEEEDEKKENSDNDLVNRFIECFETEMKKQRNGNEQTIRDRNEENLVKQLKVSNEIQMETQIQPLLFSNKIGIEQIVLKESISDINIIGNQIILQTNIYNSQNELEHNSMILVQSKALWCHTSEDYKDGIHYITVTCEKNFWGSNRKTLVVVRNAEDENWQNKKEFIIEQDIDNKIIIKEKD